jgi:hypothetical protein
MNIPQIPDIEEIKRKMAEANMNFPEPVSYPDQLQAIRDLPPMNQMPTREEIQAAMQNMPTPIPEPMVFPNITQVFFSSTTNAFSREEIQMAMQNMTYCLNCSRFKRCQISFNHLPHQCEILLCFTSTKNRQSVGRPSIAYIKGF